MNPLILQYSISPETEPTVTDLLEYCEVQHLNVIKITREPAVHLVSYDTDTFTRAQMDTNENDQNFRLELQGFLDTQMQTKQMQDTVSDPGFV